MGFHVIAVDIDDAKLALATKMGADMAIHAGRQDPVAEVHTVYTEDSLDNINAVFGRLRSGAVDGRIVMRIAEGV